MLALEVSTDKQVQVWMLVLWGWVVECVGVLWVWDVLWVCAVL